MKQLEASLFAKYLGAIVADERLLEKYIDAIKKLSIILTEEEEKILIKLVKEPFFLPFVDAGWALLKPQSNIRKRILVMSALIETEPNYTNLFLVEKNIAFPRIRLIFRGIAALLKGVLGTVLIVILGWR
ncbi:hypothetical protein [Emticicia sp. SJ17W-69]|uniref:hypothetical protein n=1 Tax=Emticicia sp. SJ17W-69 TaxID=3421657 RepID=UPI003EBD7675